MMMNVTGDLTSSVSTGRTPLAAGWGMLGRREAFDRIGEIVDERQPPRSSAANWPD
jgi:hypothetical protein